MQERSKITYFRWLFTKKHWSFLQTHPVVKVVGLTCTITEPYHLWVHASLCTSQNGCTRLSSAREGVCQLPAQGRWFSPGTPVWSTIKTDGHDKGDIMLKVAFSSFNQSINQSNTSKIWCFIVLSVDCWYRLFPSYQPHWYITNKFMMSLIMQNFIRTCKY